MIHFYNEFDSAIGSAPVKRVVIAPHADDEVLGCGGLLARYPEDSAVIVLAAPDDVRYKEFTEAKALLGYSAAYIMDCADGYIGADMRNLTSILDNVLNVLQPEELYLPYPAMHQDHIAVYEAGIRSSRLSMGSQHWYPPQVYVYDIVAYDINLYVTNLQWNVFQTLREVDIDKKVAAIHLYSSQQTTGPHPVNGVKELAHSLGASRQVAWAEQYALVRGVRT